METLWQKTKRRVARAKFRVKIKSLTEESRIIRHEEKKFKGNEIEIACSRGELWSHRTGLVRDELRHTFIAYAFFRGMEYHRIEKSDKPINKQKVVRMLAVIGKMVVTEEHLALWLMRKPVAA